MLGPSARPDPAARLRPWIGLALGVLVSWACHRAFTCEGDAQCQLGGRLGRCEATGSCSFPDGSCDSGHRYGEHASAELVGVCVPPELGSTGGSTGESETSGTSTGEPPGGSSSSGATDGCPPLVDSGPVVVMADDEVIEGLRITAEVVPAITISGRRGVTIRNCEIHHRGGPGISFAAADDLTIENVVIVHDRSDPGPHEHLDQANIVGASSQGLVIEGVRVTRGSSGIELVDAPGALLRTIEGHDIRGPGPPASFIALTDSNDVVIEDFSCINPLATGRPQSIIDIQESSDVIVRRGMLDGNNAEFGYGILFQQTAGQHSGGLVEDVDAIRMTNGSFSGFPSAFDLVFRRTRARDNICEIVSVPIDDCSDPVPGGGCVPGSGARSWTGSRGITGHRIEDSTYFSLCLGPVWPESSFLTCDGDESSLPDGDCGLTEAEFELRAPIELQPCWE